MSRREKEKASSLDKLAKFAYGAGAPPPAPPKPALTSKPAPRPSPARPAPSSPLPAPSAAAARARQKQLAQRKEKIEEEKKLKARRANELARGSNLEWRGMDTMGVPASIRRTGFDRNEPTVSEKLRDVLGEAKEKEGRAKARDKGKRQR